MTRLSQEQLAAVNAVRGPVRVVAGAGTGKTTVIVERFIRLVRDGVAPSQILVMTFTERAAREMRARIEERLGPDATPWVGTFHALTQRWLREDGRRAGVPAGFRVLAGPDRWILTWKLLWRLADDALVGVEHPEHEVGAILRLHERLKQELIPIPRLRAWAAAATESERAATMLAVARLLSAYERECGRQNRLDFDDLLERSVRLLESSPAVLAEYRARFPWVLVDEYQDTNLAQERIVELLAGDSGQVFIVGDDDQSIYRFRGASRASLERFVVSFPLQTTVQLTRNRRSSARIVRAAAGLMTHNADRVPKSLRAALPKGPHVEVRGFATGADEGRAIARQISELAARDSDLGGIAVLTRTNAVAAPLVEELRAAGIPGRTTASTGFFQQPAVKDLLAALRVVHDAGDAIAAERLRAGFGRLDAAGWDGLRENLAQLALRLGAGDLFFELMERSAFLESAEHEPALRFAQIVAEFVDREADQSLGNLLEYLGLIELSGLEPDADAPSGSDPVGEELGVWVMTIHQAKGLEFDTVFVPSLVEGRLPQPARRDRFMLPPAVLEPSVRGRADHFAEERRLLYVAMTRARHRLVLSWAARYEGERAWRRSRFVDELQAVAESDVRELPVEPPAAQVAPPAPDQPPRAPAASSERLTVSFSGLSTYRACPRQHWFRYVRRLPANPSAEGFLGDAVHRALMAAARVRQQTGRVAAAAMRRLVEAAWSERPFPEPRVEGVYKRLAMNMTATYSQNGGFAGRVFNVEHPFATPLNGALLKGVIDRIDEPREPGGPHVVIDYKTGSPLPASGLRRDFQLALYALGARRELGLGPLELEIVYLREDKRVRIAADEPLLEEAEEIATEVVQRIERGEFPAQPEIRRCRACAYRLACDSAV